MQIYSMVFDSNHGMLVTGKCTQLMAHKTHMLMFYLFLTSTLSLTRRETKLDGKFINCDSSQSVTEFNPVPSYLSIAWWMRS